MSVENTSSPATDEAAHTAPPALPQLHHPAYRVRGMGTTFHEPAPWSAARLRKVLEQQSAPLSFRTDERGLICTLDNGEPLQATPAPSHFDLRTCGACDMFEREHWSPLSCGRYLGPEGARRVTYLLDVRLATTIEVTTSTPESAADLLRALASVGLTVTAATPGMGLAEFGAATLDLGSVSLRQVDGQEVALTCKCGKPLTGSLALLLDPDGPAECPECATRHDYRDYRDEPPF